VLIMISFHLNQYDLSKMTMIWLSWEIF